ncbi:MAG: MacB family efflux pump subunit [Pseudomonadota bacterium]
MSAPPPLLQLDQIHRHYQSGDTVVRALDGVTLTIGTGEFVAIMGQSGSGKSTLMNIIGCLDKPDGGSYRINGQDIAQFEGDALAALRRETFGFVFQRYNLLATATAEENVEIPAIYAGLGKAARVARARALLTKLGIGNRADHRPAQLSGGQQQRVAIARALVNNPQVILADEPTGALDSKSGAEVMALLKALHAEGTTVILITHDEQVAMHAHRIIRLADGQVMDDTGAVEGGEGTTPTVPRTPQPTVLPELMETAKMALRALRVNLFRTLLTLLGIVIGVASVVVMLAVGNGSKQQVLSQISAMGTNLLSVRPGAPGIRPTGDQVTLVPADAKALQNLPNVDLVMGERNGRQTVRYKNIDYQTSINGTDYTLPMIKDWALESGSFFNDRDMASYAPVAVLGQTVKKNLFPDSDPIGQYVLIKNVPFEVIGVLSSKGASFMGDQDDVVFVPFTTSTIRLFGRVYVSAITVKVHDVSRIDETQTAISDLLIARHRKEDFSIRNMSSILDMATSTQNTLTILLGAVAAISLLVGGIGVMNIMLVSVTERTREIGIRMATGARKKDIMLQFITEAAVVCTIGGLAGLFIGFTVGAGLSMAGVSMLFSVAPAALAFSCAVGTGLLFGYLPAKKAADLDPVVALSSE